MKQTENENRTYGCILLVSVIKLFEKRNNNMKRNDFVLLVVFLAIIGILFGANLLAKRNVGKTVIITVDGNTYGTYSLNKNQEIKINDTNVLMIQDGCAYMKEATCSEQICVKHKAITKNNETIICLPNKLVVELCSGEESTLDSITK